MKKDNPFIPKPPALIPDIPIVWPPNALVTNIKGGVGKSSLSRAINHHWGSTIITHDLCYGQDKEDIVHLEPRSRSLPSEIRGLSSVYLDPEAIRQLKERAKQEGRPISEIIRKSVQT